MGFALTLAYIVLMIISPEQFGAEFASHHPMLYLAGVTGVASAPWMRNHMREGSAIQTRLMAAFLLAIALSELANGWFGGAVQGWQTILPNVAVFFFIVANVTTIRRLKIIIGVTVAICLGIAAEALCGYYGGFRSSVFVLLQYGTLPRLRGAGFLNDPNDLAQMLLVALPLLFLAWSRGRTIVNSFTVLAPSAFLLFAVYLTHSRGALVTLGVLVVVAAQEWIGKTASMLMAGILVFGMMSLDFTGGRGISSEGEGRLEAWSMAFQFFKRAPLFGVGFGRFTEFTSITAHNSFMLCLAELGLVGSIIWIALLVTTMMDLNHIMTRQAPEQTEAFVEASDEKPDPFLEAVPRFAEAVVGTNAGGGLWKSIDGVEAGHRSWAINELSGEGENIPPAWCAPSFESETAKNGPLAATNTEPDGRDMARKFGTAMRLSLVSFLVTSFFLSRSYSTALYLVLGLATATILLTTPEVESEDSGQRVLVTLGMEAAAIAFVYCVVRFRH